MAPPKQETRDYMQDIGKIPLVSREEEIYLAERIKKGDETARIKLIESNLRLVVKIAHDFKGYGLPLLDLISEGNIGLMRAVTKFDPARGAKLSSYAAWWIKQSMRRALSERGRTIRIPISTAVKMIKIQRARGDYMNERGCEPSPEDISSRLGYSPRTIARLTRNACLARTVSLSEPIAKGEKGTIEELVGSNPDGDSFIETLDKEDYARLRNIVDKTLDERERGIIYRRYGLDGNPPMTLEEISKTIGRTRERVRQIQVQALRKLKSAIGEEGLLGPETATKSQDSTGPKDDEAISAYYFASGENLSATARRFDKQYYQAEAALIRTGAIKPEINMLVIKAYLDCGNIKKAAKETGISESAAARERMRYLASLEYLQRQTPQSGDKQNPSKSA